MNSNKTIKAHIIATVIAIMTIAIFFASSLIAEIIGHDHTIQRVKKGILYGLPILIVSMPILGLTGKKLAGKRRDPKLLIKMLRMKFIAMNGAILILLAIFLYYRATYEGIDHIFLIVQIIELTIGAINLVLIASNIRSGLQLTKARSNRTINND